MKCNFRKSKEPCTPECECYINSPENYNCWNCFKYKIDKSHTLYECSKILNISHTTVSHFESLALSKLEEILKEVLDLKD